MCDDQYIITQETLQWMKNIAHDYPNEICTHLISYNQTLYVNKDSISLGGPRMDDEGNIRQSCEYNRNLIKEYIFHSHPFSSGSYPSKEDVMKVFKHTETKVSIIATRWGLYTIKNSDIARTHYKNIKNTNKYNQLLEYVKQKLHDIGRINVNEVELTLEQLNIILITLNKISRKTALSLKFCSWKELQV